MKTSISRHLLRLALLVSLAAAPLARAEGEGATATAKLSAPDKPATLRVDMPWADIRILGVDGDTVTVESSLNQKSTKPARPGALRRLDNEVSFEVTEKDNVVTVALAGDNPWAGHDAEFKISVPRTMSLDIKTQAGGDLAVKDVTGDVSIENMNGEVRLDGLVGSTVISTMNGEVQAVYAQTPVKPISISSMNGEVDLRLPADSKANIVLRTHNGSILTDFSEDVLTTKSEAGKSSGYSYSRDEVAVVTAAESAARAAADMARDAAEVSRTVAREVQREVSRAGKAGSPAPRPPRTPRPPIPPMTGGKLITGTLNGGGVDIKVTTMNGEITLRQSK